MQRFFDFVHDFHIVFGVGQLGIPVVDHDGDIAAVATERALVVVMEENASLLDVRSEISVIPDEAVFRTFTINVVGDDAREDGNILAVIDDLHDL
jgi:hypothetical protein